MVVWHRCGIYYSARTASRGPACGCGRLTRLCRVRGRPPTGTGVSPFDRTYIRMIGRIGQEIRPGYFLLTWPKSVGYSVLDTALGYSKPMIKVIFCNRDGQKTVGAVLSTSSRHLLHDGDKKSLLTYETHRTSTSTRRRTPSPALVAGHLTIPASLNSTEPACRVPWEHTIPGTGDQPFRRLSPSRHDTAWGTAVTEGPYEEQDPTLEAKGA